MVTGVQTCALPILNQLAGRVADVTYYGGRIECLVRLDGADEQTIAMNVEKHRKLAVGDEVFIGVDPMRIRIWPL